MDISMALFGQISATAESITDSSWVNLRDDDSGITISLFVPTEKAAQRIADAINAAFESEGV